MYIIHEWAEVHSVGWTNEHDHEASDADSREYIIHEGAEAYLVCSTNNHDHDANDAAIAIATQVTLSSDSEQTA